MAQITINIPDAIAPRVRDAFAAATGYTDTVPNPAHDPTQPTGPANPESIPNPVGKMTWVKARLIDYIRETAMRAEVEQLDAAQRAEREGTIADFSNKVTGIG